MTDPTTRLAAALADRYRLERELGQGGMATVYLAQDLKHDRKVAIKVLKPELAAVLGAERFVQEIKTTAALSHPHILPLFDSGEAGGFLYYVMPYIQGETIREKLNRETQFGIEEAVRITTAVADALDYAHRNGVIHRDIKPENILLHDGRPMVMDFGIALALSAAAGGRMTETGLSLGTPHYMSPEQATAEKEITARSDVYSLASVLYEMLTGNPPHVGASAQQIIMKIIAEPVQLVTALRKNVAPHIAAALTQALEKLPADRFESAKAFAAALENPHFTHPSIAVVPALAAGGGRRFGVLPLTAVGLVGLALGVGAAQWAWPRAAAAPAPRFYLVGDSARRITPNFAVSPDGTVLVYLAITPSGPLLFQQRLSELEPRPIPGTEDAAADPLSIFFAPDGSTIGYATESSLRRVGLDGSDPRTITTMHGTFAGGTWGLDGTIVFAAWPDTVLWRVPAGGGTPTPIPLHGGGHVTPVSPELLPGGRSLLCQDIGEQQRLGVVDLATGAFKPIAIGTVPSHVAPGTLVYGRTDGSIVAQPFDAGRGDTTGPATVLVQGVVLVYGALLDFRVASNGVLVYLPVTPGGAMLRMLPGAVLSTGPRFWGPRVSPDGRRIVYGAYASGGSGADLWIYDLTIGTDQRLTTGGQTGRDYNDGTWSPDGRWLALSAADSSDPGNKGLYVMRSDGSTRPELVLSLPGNQFPTDWTPDGRAIVLTRNRPNEPSEIWMVPAFGDHRPVPLVQSAYGARGGRISPDGRWLAFEADETGRAEVYIQRFPAPGARVRVSESGGRMPVWSRDGRRLFYWNRDQLLVARVQAGAEMGVTDRVVYSDLTIPNGTILAQYDVLPDGRVVASAVPAAASRLAVVTDIRTLARE